MKPAWLNPTHPERVCWGCDQFCPAEKLGCANGSIRTPHPSELFGEDWRDWETRGEGRGQRAEEKIGKREEGEG